VSEDGKRTPQIGWERWEEKASSYSIEIRNMGNASTMGPPRPNSFVPSPTARNNACRQGIRLLLCFSHPRNSLATTRPALHTRRFTLPRHRRNPTPIGTCGGMSCDRLAECGASLWP
jgi:hypothetical protein